MKTFQSIALYAAPQGALYAVLAAVVVLVPGRALGQNLAQSSSGVAASWVTAENIATFADHANRMKPLLERLDPQQWVAEGAPDVYVGQHQNVLRELAYLTDAAELFQRQPERLTAALDTYFRFESLEWRMESLIEGVRRYENPAIGDLILAELKSNSANRDQLRQYITELASQKEDEFRVVDNEAQRCRDVTKMDSRGR